MCCWFCAAALTVCTGHGAECFPPLNHKRVVIHHRLVERVARNCNKNTQLSQDVMLCYRAFRTAEARQAEKMLDLCEIVWKLEPIPLPSCSRIILSGKQSDTPAFEVQPLRKCARNPALHGEQSGRVGIRSEPGLLQKMDCLSLYSLKVSFENRHSVTG